MRKTVPVVLDTARGQQKTEGTVFPNTDRPWLGITFLFFSKNLTNGCEKNLLSREQAGWGEYCPLSEPIRL